jgi:hypothetical protein
MKKKIEDILIASLPVQRLSRGFPQDIGSSEKLDASAHSQSSRTPWLSLQSLDW